MGEHNANKFNIALRKIYLKIAEAISTLFSNETLEKWIKNQKWHCCALSKHNQNKHDRPLFNSICHLKYFCYICITLSRLQGVVGAASAMVLYFWGVDHRRLLFSVPIFRSLC